MLSQDEINQTQLLLSKLERGEIPTPIFHEIAKLVVLSTLELIILHRQGDNITVLLTRREANDSVWPNLLHIPGTILRMGDNEDLSSAITRTTESELGGIEIATPRLLKPHYRHSKRGAELSLVYVAQVADKFSGHEFFDVTSLPADIVESQTELIQEAALNFRNLSSTTTR